jgi:hypothetical protein
MGLFDKLMDRFNKAEFTIAPNKKLKSLSKEFKEAYDLSLVFYKGNMIADGDLTLGALNQKTSANIATTSKDGIKIKGNMLVKDVEKSFLDTYGVTVQIKNKKADKLCDNNISLGEASRNQ